jgi:hypothetical protein
MSNRSNPVFQECCFFTGRLRCHAGQYSAVRNERAFCNNAHDFKHIARLKGMFYVNNTAYIYIAKILIFPKEVLFL